MMRKILRWSLFFILLLLLLVGGGLYFVNAWLNTNEEKLLNDYVATAGLEVAVRRIDLSWWADWPRVTLAVDSIAVRDSLLSRNEPPLLALEHVRAELDLGDLLRDTLHLRAAALRNGSIHLVSDSSGRFNAGTLLDAAPAPPAEDGPHVEWNGLRADVINVDFYHENPPKDKRISAHIDSLHAKVNVNADGRPELDAYLNTYFNGLAFNTKKGAYLSDTRLEGPIEATFGEKLVFAPTELLIGGQRLRASAEIDRRQDSLSHIYLAGDSVHFERTRRMLHDTLQAKLAEYHVEGPFPVDAHIITSLRPGEDPEVRADFALRGQRVKLKQYRFNNATATGSMVNRLSVAEGGIPNSRRNLRMEARDLTAYYGGVRIESPGVVVAAAGRNAMLRGPLQLSGPTEAIGEYLGNTDFFLNEGSFDLGLVVDASLLSFPEIVATTRADLRIRDVDVAYRPAGVSFGFDYIELDKTSDDITFDIQSARRDTGLNFQLTGEVDDILPLVLDGPDRHLRTDVTLHSPRIDWTDFTTYFGENGMLAEEDTTAREVRRARALKQTLRGLADAFRPDLGVKVDTLAYYDVLRLTDFQTGLHFADDTLVLEETSFDWVDSELAFGARVRLSEADTTPFALEADTEHLDLNRLRPTLEYFGLKLPPGLDTLPGDLNLTFEHAGVINDTFGLMEGANAGAVFFDDGAQDLFSGNLTYAPGPLGTASHLHLEGDPHVVNVLARAENFFFGTGHFSLDLSLPSVPDSLRQLFSDAELRLRIDSSQVAYRPAGVFVPLEEFAVDYADGHADYALYLLTDSTERHVLLHGELDNMGAFLFPEVGGNFRICTDATARVLSLNDLQRIVRRERDTTKRVDTTSFDLRQLLSATGGIFADLRPDLSLLVDTFWLGEVTPLTDISAALRMQDSSELAIEDTGFGFGDSRVRLAANYRIDRRRRSPFMASYRVDDFDLDGGIEELTAAGIELPDEMGDLSGTLSFGGSISGTVDERGETVLIDSTSGKLDYELDSLVLHEWPVLQDIGRKTFMRKRFRTLRFAPLTGTVTLDSGVVRIPRAEVQSTGVQAFVEGTYDLEEGPNLLVSLPLRNIGRGLLQTAPSPTGYGGAGWKVYLVAETDKEGNVKTRFRLGRRRYDRERADQLRRE